MWRGHSTKTCRRRKRFAAQAGNWIGATVRSSHARDSFAVQALWALLLHTHPLVALALIYIFWMHFLPRGAKAQGVSIFYRLNANCFWRTGFGNQSCQPCSWLFRITGQFEDLGLFCLLNSSISPAFLYLLGQQKEVEWFKCFVVLGAPDCFGIAVMQMLCSGRLLWVEFQYFVPITKR